MTSTFTTNRGYRKQGTGDNVNTWGALLNTDVFDIIDKNLGGALTKSVAGSSDVTLTTSESQNLIHHLTGVLTGNINYIFPAAGGFFYISNETTGSFIVTVKALGGSTGLIIPQGTVVPIYIDGSALIVNGATGTNPMYTAGTVTGTGTALIVSTTIPSNFNLITGVFLAFVPTNANIGAATLLIQGGPAITIKKLSPGGLVDMDDLDLTLGVPIIAYYNGTYWVALNIIYEPKTTTRSTGFSMAFSDLFTLNVCTSSFTITLPQVAGFPPYFAVEILAFGGAITLTPNATDQIQGGTAGASIILPQGASCRIYTDGSTKWWVNYLGPKLNTESTIASATSTDLGTVASNIVSISGTTTITGFGSTASTATPLYFIRFTGALTLTYNATSLIIPGAANITTVAGDTATVKYEGSGNWRLLSYQKTNGQAIVTASAGIAIGAAFTQSGAVSSGSTAIPLDNTIPQNTEGNQYMTVSYTPTNSSNKLVIEIRAFLANSAGGTLVGALFQDSTASALAVGASRVASTDAVTPVIITYIMTAGTTSSTTFNFRGGGQSGTTTFNGTSATNLFNGTLISSMRVTEYTQ